MFYTNIKKSFSIISKIQLLLNPINQDWKVIRYL